MILGLLILTAALERTGVVELTGRAALRYTGNDSDRLYRIVIVVSAGLGSVISNTASTTRSAPVGPSRALKCARVTDDQPRSLPISEKLCA